MNKTGRKFKIASNVSIKEKFQQPQEDNEYGMRINTDISDARDKIYNYSQFTAGVKRTLMEKIKVIVKKKKIKLESLYY